MASDLRQLAPDPDVSLPAGEARPQRPVCVACGDVIGVYEPLVRLVGGAPIQTARAASSATSNELSGPLWHAGCWPG